MAKSAGKQLQLGIANIAKRLESATKEIISPSRQKPIADFVLSLIIKRTRLGYGVKENFGQKYNLPKHSESYILLRRNSRDLSGTTSPNKSNLTFTGELLQSTKVTKLSRGQIVISPTGSRGGGLSNKRLAEILAGEMKNGKKYIYNKLSQLEYQQLLRFYRKTFGDLLRKQKLLR